MDFSALYKTHAATLTARLTRQFGPHRLEAVECGVQDAFAKAMVSWPRRGVPEEPRAWLHVVARNAVLDQLRAHAKFDDQPIGGSVEAPAVTFEEEPDEVIAMMFVTCHPSLQLASRVALTLRTLCGFEVDEIAAALLATPQTVEKRLVRARKRLRDEGITFELPAADERSRRLESVLAVLYLLFNEGYASLATDERVRRDLVDEALRLTGLLLPIGDPRVNALLALMCLHASRLDARVGSDGVARLLEEQDRRLWDRELIALGLQHLAASASGPLTRWHLEAGIAAAHATAPDFASTDWAGIVGYYDQLIARTPSAVLGLNRAVALGFALGPEAGLAALDALEPELAEGGLFHAARGDVLRRLGRIDPARAAYARALERVRTEPERRHLRRQLADL